MPSVRPHYIGTYTDTGGGIWLSGCDRAACAKTLDTRAMLRSCLAAQRPSISITMSMSMSRKSSHSSCSTVIHLRARPFLWMVADRHRSTRDPRDTEILVKREPAVSLITIPYSDCSGVGYLSSLHSDCTIRYADKNN